MRGTNVNYAVPGGTDKDLLAYLPSIEDIRYREKPSHFCLH